MEDSKSKGITRNLMTKKIAVPRTSSKNPEADQPKNRIPTVK
jgi:hypothetical protein